MTLTFPDAEAAARDWAKVVTHALVADRVFFGTPDAGYEPAWVTVGLFAPATVTDSDVPEFTAPLQFDCWATTKKAACALAMALVNAAANFTPQGQVGQARGYGMTEIGMQWLPDPDRADRARYVVSIRIGFLPDDW